MTALTGRIITNHGPAVAVETEDGRVLRGTARRKLGLVVCGDYVEYEMTGSDAVITKVAPRSSEFGRPDRRRRIKPLATNIDRLFIVSAHKPGIDEYLIDCYLITAENMGVDATLIFNKSDLEHDADKLHQMATYYRSLGYSVIETSVEDGTGIDTLTEQLKGNTNIFVGQSGVGKSSLIQLLLPDQDIQVGALSQATGLGSHTTTTTILYHFPNGGDLVDSPGVREFSIWRYNETELRQGFKEFLAKSEECKFNNCRHLTEPHCAVKQALDNGEIAAWRLRHYKKMLEEASENELLP